MTQTDLFPTGVPEVDRVVAAVTALEDRDPAEHVAVFEEAHQTLRAALNPTVEPG